MQKRLTSDVEGFDAVYKLAIMASLSFGINIDVNLSTGKALRI